MTPTTRVAGFEIRLKLGKDIELVVPFEDGKDLEARLQSLDIEEVKKILEKKTGVGLGKEPRSPKPGLEQVYRFTPEGLVELIKSPGNEPKTVALVLYAYHPEAASIEQISASSGVKAVSQKYLSHKSYSGYFERRGQGMYALSQGGLTWVTSKILPELTSGASG